MRAEIKERWITALLSGMYKQGTGALRKLVGHAPDAGDRFCCLGVLCELAVEDGVTEFWLDGNGYPTYGNSGNFSESALPIAVRQWAGISSHGDYDARALTLDNDEGQTFEQIAEIIREKF